MESIMGEDCRRGAAQERWLAGDLFFGVMRIEPEIVCAGWLEENVHMCQLKSRLLVGLHVTVVYVYSQQTRRQRFSVTFDSATKHGYSHALAICTSSQAIC